MYCCCCCCCLCIKPALLAGAGPKRPASEVVFEAVFGFGKIEEKLVKNEQIVVEFVCMSRQPWLQPDMSPSGS